MQNEILDILKNVDIDYGRYERIKKSLRDSVDIKKFDNVYYILIPISKLYRNKHDSKFYCEIFCNKKMKMDKKIKLDRILKGSGFGIIRKINDNNLLRPLYAWTDSKYGEKNNHLELFEKLKSSSEDVNGHIMFFHYTYTNDDHYKKIGEVKDKDNLFFENLVREPFLGKYKYKLNFSKKRNIFSNDTFVEDTMKSLISVLGEEKETDKHKYSSQAYNAVYITGYCRNRTFSIYVNDYDAIDMISMILLDDANIKVQVCNEL